MQRPGQTTSPTIAILDTGVLYAAADAHDAHHVQARTFLEQTPLRLILPAMVAAEATYFVGKHRGPRDEAAFLRGLAVFDLEAPTPLDFGRMAELVDYYSNFPLGGTDASIVALAERLGAHVIATFDRRHFGAIRPQHAERFTLLPN